HLESSARVRDACQIEDDCALVAHFTTAFLSDASLRLRRAEAESKDPEGLSRRNSIREFSGRVIPDIPGAWRMSETAYASLQRISLMRHGDENILWILRLRSGLGSQGCVIAFKSYFRERHDGAEILTKAAAENAEHAD